MVASLIWEEYTLGFGRHRTMPTIQVALNYAASDKHCAMDGSACSGMINVWRGTVGVDRTLLDMLRGEMEVRGRVTCCNRSCGMRPCDASCCVFSPSVSDGHDWVFSEAIQTCCIQCTFKDHDPARA
jgi:hypothetical protein